MQTVFCLTCATARSWLAIQLWLLKSPQEGKQNHLCNQPCQGQYTELILLVVYLPVLAVYMRQVVFCCHGLLYGHIRVFLQLPDLSEGICVLVSNLDSCSKRFKSEGETFLWLQSQNIHRLFLTASFRSLNRRVAWVEGNLKDHRVPTSLLQAQLPTTRSSTWLSCPQLNLTWLFISWDILLCLEQWPDNFVITGVDRRYC